MNQTASISAVPFNPSHAHAAARAALGIAADGGSGTASTRAAQHSSRWRDGLALLQKSVAFTRQVVHAGDVVYHGGQPFSTLYVINAGQFKTVNISDDGRDQVVGLHFKGDWLGFDGIDSGHHGCDAIALDTAEVWAIRYATLLEACASSTELMRTVHAAMSGQIARDGQSMLSLGTLPAHARVAKFLLDWTEALAARDLRTDQISLHMSRAEIGNFLGLTLETVSRALSRLARSGVIRFDEKGRRNIAIPSVQGLREVIRETIDDVRELATPSSRLAPAPRVYRAC
jgi:CRP/FNR family transcriptional regulator, anaerobic regulatory protein